MSTARQRPPTSRDGAAALEWWREIAEKRRDRGVLARIRRSRRTVEVLQVPEAIDLARRLGAGAGGALDADVRAKLDVARVIAHIREHEPRDHPMRVAGWKTFPGGRRESEAGDERPRLAEARFRRLMQVSHGEEKVAAFVRLIALLDGRVKVDDMASDFIRWSHPLLGDRVRERWAFLYYAAGEFAPLPPSDSDSQSAEELTS